MSTAPALMMLFFKAWLAVILLLTLPCPIRTDHRVVKMMMTAALWMEQLMVGRGTVSQEVSPPTGVRVTAYSGLELCYPQLLVWLSLKQRLIAHRSTSLKSDKAHSDNY